MHRHDAPDRAGVHVAQPADQYLADARAGTRLRIELDLRIQDSRFRIEVPQTLRVGIEQNHTDHVTPEFDFIAIALLAEAQPPHVPLAGPPARSCRSDRAFERVVVERPVTDERQTPNHPLLFLSGEDGRRYQGGEQQAGYDAQLT